MVTPTEETSEAIRSGARALGEAGARVEELRPPGIDEGYEIVTGLFGADGGAASRRLLAEAGTEDSSLGDRGEALSPVERDALQYRWDRFRSHMLSFLADWDVILSPVNANPALPHGESTAAGLTAFSYTMTYNLLGWPGTVVRGGTSPEGLPVGVQIVSRPWREDVGLAVASHLEQTLGGFRPPAL